jgi:ribosomal protein L29
MAKVLKTLEILTISSSKYHKRLSECFSASHSSSSLSSSIKLPAKRIEEIQELLSNLKSNDEQFFSLCRSESLSNLSLPLLNLKKSLTTVKFFVSENIKHVKKDLSTISTILKEFKERCQKNFLEFLKSLDLDLRKALKPLVPVKVLQEQLKFCPINPERLLNSLRSAPVEEEKDLNSTVDKLNNHIQLLINTLETVAKDLIAMTQATSSKYYEITDPLSLYSEPPSPLAAPLPDYFSYDLATLEVQEEPRSGMQLSEQSKKKIMEKLKNISSGKDSSCEPLPAKRLAERLSKLFQQGVKEIDLLGCLKEEGVPISDREKIVFDIINTERTSGLDVNLDDIILAEEIEKRDHFFEVSRNDYEDVLKNIEGKELTDRFEDRSQFGSLQSSIDEKLVRATSKKEVGERKKAFTPVTLLRPENKIRSKSKISLHNIKVKNITPSKLPKSQPKRSNTPGLKKKKKNS